MRFVLLVTPDREIAGEGDTNTVVDALQEAASSAAAGAKLISVRVEGDEEDLLYSLPADGVEAALAALPADVDAFRPGHDEGFRNWFRGRWVGMDEELHLTEEEIRATPLTAERILNLLDPPEHRDWRPVQTCLERWASCAELARAMSRVTTRTQRRRLASVFTRRARPCRAAIPHLIRWLEDPDQQVAHDAADGLGVLLLTIRDPKSLIAAQRAAGEPLLRCARAHPAPFVLTALGVTAHPPARAFLEDLAVNAGDATLRLYAVRALRNFDWYRSPRHAGERPPFLEDGEPSSRRRATGPASPPRRPSPPGARSPASPAAPGARPDRRGPR